MGDVFAKKDNVRKEVLHWKACMLCHYKYPLDYIMYHEDRCGVRINSKKLLTKEDKKKRIK